MKIKVSFLRLAVLAALVPWLGACSTMAAHEKAGYQTPTLSNAEYLVLPPEEQVEYRKSVKQESDDLAPKQDAEYKAGRPVHTGEGNTAGTMIWNKLLNQVSIYHGHITGEMGMELGALVIYKTKEDGQIEYQKVNGVWKPTIVMAQPFSQESSGRMVVKTAGQVLTGFGNGLFAEIYRSEHGCDDCGGISINNVGGNSSSGAVSGSSSVSETDSNVNIRGLTW